MTLNILIVEDMADMARMLSFWLQPLIKRFPGSKLTFVATVDEALIEAARIPSPDVTFLDLVLPPGFNQEETLLRLEHIAALTPVVILSGIVDEEVRERVQHFGEYPVLEKSEALAKNGLLFSAIGAARKIFNGKATEEQALRWAKIDAALAELSHNLHAVPA